jgi:ATP-dependent DNA helicase RecG
MYGNLDISKIDQMPPGRQRVDTFVVDESYRVRLDAFISKQVAEGSQVYIVCPAVEESETEEGELSFSDITMSEIRKEEKLPLKAAVKYAEEISERLPHLNIAFVHGKMKASQKDAIMTDFADGKIDVLVSTTVIEVGINVPNATLMIVENADRFGLSQLHQLRGRVGRGKKKAYCILVTDCKTSGLGENARRRLETMRTTYDGYKIAEYDLQFRGPGDYFPRKNGNARQSGSFGGMVNADMLTLKEAMTAAEAVLKDDPRLEKEENIYASFLTRQLISADEKAMQ